jgi:hypothetical protein
MRGHHPDERRRWSIDIAEEGYNPTEKGEHLRMAIQSRVAVSDINSELVAQAPLRTDQGGPYHADRTTDVGI